MSYHPVDDYLPYPKWRPYQREAAEFCYEVLERGKVGLLCAPCGIGKSVAVLAAFLALRSEWGEGEFGESPRLMALTRTRNQLDIYCRELKRIRDRVGVRFVAAMFKSKRELCPLIREKRVRGLRYRDFLEYCRDLKRSGGCRYYRRTREGRRYTSFARRAARRIIDASPLLPDEAYEEAVAEEVCPYEVLKIVAYHADIIVGNYNYVLVEPVRAAIFAAAGLELAELNLVFDEAHSLPNYATDLLSDELPASTVERAIREADEFHVEDRGVLAGLHALIERYGNEARLRGERRGEPEEEMLVDRVQLVRELLESPEVARGLTETGLRRLLKEMEEEGEKIRLARAEEGKRPVSYVARTARFLRFWTEADAPYYAFYARCELGRERRWLPRIGVACLDPSVAVQVVQEARSVILMSGTLWHFDYYVEVLGLPKDRVAVKRLPSPFPRRHRRILVDLAVTTRYEARRPELWKRFAARLQKVLEAVPGRTAVYFPSYHVMRNILAHLESDTPIIQEDEATSVRKVLDFLRSHQRAALCAVSRGKVSEGVDLTHEGRSLLDAVVIAGLPYARRTELEQRILEYYRQRFGAKAFEYAVAIPCANAVAQAAGRLIRGPHDRGVVLIMDSRTIGRFRHLLPLEWRQDMEAYRSLRRLLTAIQRFFHLRT